MSYIPPLVCDTPPPIDFEDSHEDDFGDGMFSNYDGSSLPTTPKQSPSLHDQVDLPTDVPELPDLPDITVTQSYLSENRLGSNHQVEVTDLSSSNVIVPESNCISNNEISPELIKPNVGGDSRKENEPSEVSNVDSNLYLQTNEFCETHGKQESSENSSSLHIDPSDSVCRSESPPSLVFSVESLNCDDNQSVDFEELHQNTDDVECNFPSLKLDSISDTKSQSSDSEDTNNSVNCELGESREVCETRNSNSDMETKIVKTQSDYVECHSTVANDSFDDFVEFDGNADEAVQHDGRDKDVVGKPQPSTESTEIQSCDENAFAADFSQFEAFSEKKSNEPDQYSEGLQHEKVNDQVDDFDGFKTVDDNDDDEFGEFNDFSDFHQSQTFTSTLPTNVEELSARIKPLLDNLFPNIDHESEDGNYDALDLANDTTSIIKDFENSKALDHQWLSSVGKSSLVTALGIDSRNILYGGKWNSSMPRFAANLGLEPIKPSSVFATTSSANTSTSNEIPAVQFDWNSSGLVNPLDGVQEILHKTNSAENQSSRIELDWHSTKAEPSLIAQTPQLSNIHTTLNMNPNDFIVNGESTQTSASYVVPGSSGTLKETHIFTPSKSIYSTIQSRELANEKPESKCSDFDYEKAAAGIIIDENVVKKEYRDLEYDPDKALSNDDFSDFQSVPIASNTQLLIGHTKKICQWNLESYSQKNVIRTLLSIGQILGVLLVQRISTRLMILCLLEMLILATIIETQLIQLQNLNLLFPHLINFRNQ